MVRAKLLVLGIDAANPVLLERWAHEGALPALQHLFARAAVASTCGVEGFFVGSTWPSFSSGVNPAGHGVHYLAQLRPGSYVYERISERPERSEPFWVTASRAGQRVAVLDVPLSRMAPALNGIQTVEWGGHDSVYGFQAYPSGLHQEIMSRFGAHPQPGSCDGPRRTAADYELFVDRLVRGATLKGELTRALLARGGWDLFVQVFTEAHCVGHQCWHLHDTTHPGYDPRVAEVVGDPLLRVYRSIDAAIGEILADADDARVFIVVAHGMSHQYGAQILLPEILFRLGIAERAPPGPGSSLPLAFARRLWRSFPAGTRDLLEPVARRLRPAVVVDGLPQLAVDPARSLCFPVSNGLPIGGIRLNLVGREPAGLLEPGAEADRFCDQLAADLVSVRNPDTDRPLVRRVSRTRELYRGPCVDALPDLLVEWSDDGPIGNTVTGPAASAVVRAGSDKIGLLEGENGWGRTGEHRPRGLIAAAGPGITPMRLREVDLLDIAPTILTLLGLEPRGLDGSPVHELLSMRPSPS